MLLNRGSIGEGGGGGVWGGLLRGAIGCCFVHSSVVWFCGL